MDVERESTIETKHLSSASGGLRYAGPRSPRQRCMQLPSIFSGALADPCRRYTPAKQPSLKRQRDRSPPNPELLSLVPCSLHRRETSRNYQRLLLCAAVECQHPPHNQAKLSSRAPPPNPSQMVILLLPSIPTQSQRRRMSFLIGFRHWINFRYFTSKEFSSTSTAQIRQWPPLSPKRNTLTMPSTSVSLASRSQDRRPESHLRTRRHQKSRSFRRPLQRRCLSSHQR